MTSESERDSNLGLPQSFLDQVELGAKCAAVMMNSFKDHGFSRNDAFQLTLVSMKSLDISYG